MRFNTLSEWLHWQEALHPSAIDLGLDRVRMVANRLQLLQPQARVVTVAGTNGKGSCVATLEALCLATGVTVGAFTSPHFLRYNERIRINGCEVSDQQLCEAFARIDEARGDTSLTYFEFGALAALDLMQREAVEVMLLEVGLGGRLDAVNIIDADVAVVTSIALDHMDWLGSDLSTIGYEKAGVFRPLKWAICADQQAPASVGDYAHDIGAYWVPMGLSLNALKSADGCHWHWQGMSADGRLLQERGLPLPALPLGSVAAAMQVFVLLGYALPEPVAPVVQQLSLTGRGQRLQWQQRQLLLDVAHNPAAAELLAKRLQQEPAAAIHCVVAMMADKDRAGVLEPLLERVQSWFVSEIPEMPRSATSQQLLADLLALQEDARVSAFPSVAQALDEAVRQAGPDDLILVMGSFFTVAATLERCGKAS